MERAQSNKKPMALIPLMGFLGQPKKDFVSNSTTYQFSYWFRHLNPIVLPHVENTKYARHVYANFRKAFSSIEFKNMFWTVANSNIREFNLVAYDHLMARELKLGGMACKGVENGMAEGFNVIIHDARKKPLLAMHEDIRLYMMEMLFNLKQDACKWVNDVCPGPIKKMDELGFDIKSWYIHPSGLNAYEERNNFHSYIDPTRFISTWFGKDKVLATYESNILPANGSNMYKPKPYTKPLPHVERGMPGRPCMKRKRHVLEHEDRFSQVSCKGRIFQCQNCIQRGHNKLSCKNPSFHPTPKSRKKIGRPWLNPELTNCKIGGRGSKTGGRSGEEVSEFVPQTSPTFNSEDIPQTDVEIDVEGDGLDIDDMDQIMHDLSYLSDSKYNDAKILFCLNITQSKLKEFDSFLHQSKQVANSERVPETHEDNDEVRRRVTVKMELKTHMRTRMKMELTMMKTELMILKLGNKT
uniref:Uncharacterized protein n=1 Tax=Lactuca sativa TaxID=4236 RepID=A0A9R1W436_LACSA|nr:hypothetical protein LSAT_V11C300148440 [Lactuca sativa]